MKNYKSMRGANIDVAKLMLQQEKNISVGNTRSNARGDQLGRGGRVVKGADEIAREHYNKNNPRAVKQTSIKLDDADVKRQIEEAKNNPDPITDDWKEPEQEEVQVEPELEEEVQVKEVKTEPKDEWVEDEDGNFVKASEVKKTSKKTSKKN